MYNESDLKGCWNTVLGFLVVVGILIFGMAFYLGRLHG